MKKIPNNFLVLSLSVATAIIILAVFFQFSETQTSLPYREKIFPINLREENASDTPIRMQDMNPNDAVYFMYPSAISSDTENYYQKFILIRLPILLDGDSNDISSFRAFSAVDLASHCILHYYPQIPERQIEDPCISPPYRTIDGISIAYPDTNILRGTSTGALPMLDLSTDEEGYIYVEPPQFTEQKNGVIGVGRQVSQEDFDKGAKIMQEMSLELEEKLDSFYIPRELSTGHRLININNFTMAKEAWYELPTDIGQTIQIKADFCKCSKNYREILDTVGLGYYSGFWKVGDYDIMGSPSKVDTVSGSTSAYMFIFYKDGFRTTIFTNLSFEDGMKLVLENYFPNFTLSDAKKIDIKNSD